MIGWRGRRLSFAYDHDLVDLIARAEGAAARLTLAPAERLQVVAGSARREAAAWSARLDASPLSDETAANVDAALSEGEHEDEPATADPRRPTAEGGWERALKLDGLPTQDVAAMEYRNVLRCFDSEAELIGVVLTSPLEALGALHERLCAGLVDAEAVGRPRRTEQAVHDGAQGRMLYVTPPPDELAELMDRLATWLSDHSARFPAVVVAGVVHECLLEWQPFEAANGRLARSAARLVLRARGLDPLGLGAFERHLARDVLGYHEEVAATIRRGGDLSPWLERWAEAVVTALETAARQAVGGFEPLPAQVEAFIDTLEGGGIIDVNDYAERVRVGAQRAWTDLRALERHGLLERVPGARGLRWRRRSA